MDNHDWLNELEISAGDHVIAIVTDDREVNLLAPYYKPALDEGHPCVAVASPSIVGEIQSSLRDAGMSEHTDSVAIHDPREMGMENDKFSVDRFLDQAGQRIGKLLEAGATRVRHAGIMRWLDDASVDDNDRIYLEARINQVIEGACMSGFCVYDSRHISGHLLVQLLRTHPKVLLVRHVIHNPFYVTPDLVISELGR